MPSPAMWAPRAEKVAICPNCHIVLVEASSASMTNLGTAVNEAVQARRH